MSLSLLLETLFEKAQRYQPRLGYLGIIHSHYFLLHLCEGAGSFVSDLTYKFPTSAEISARSQHHEGQGSASDVPPGS